MPNRSQPARHGSTSVDVRMAVPLPFDIPTLIEHMNSKDPLATVIRAHLYIEFVLIRQIQAVLVHKSRFDSATLLFDKRVRLAAALGVVDQADFGALNALNSLRNKFAHNIDFQVKEQDERDFYNALSERQRRFVDSLRFDSMDYMARLRTDLVGLIFATNEATSAS